MRATYFVFIALFFTAVPFSDSMATNNIKNIPTLDIELKVTTNKENVVASRIRGKWVIDLALTNKLQGHKNNKKIEFKDGPMFLKDIPKEYKEYFKDKIIYFIGIMKKRGTEHPCFLSVTNGNPHMFYFRTDKTGNKWNTESFNIMLSVAEDIKDDILFIGGDYNNQPFTGFVRE